MDESIFQSGLKLHLTVSVFSLFDEREVDEAKQTLQDCKESVFKYVSFFKKSVKTH